MCVFLTLKFSRCLQEDLFEETIVNVLYIHTSQKKKLQQELYPRKNLLSHKGETKVLNQESPNPIKVLQPGCCDQHPLQTVLLELFPHPTSSNHGNNKTPPVANTDGANETRIAKKLRIATPIFSGPSVPKFFRSSSPGSVRGIYSSIVVFLCILHGYLGAASWWPLLKEAVCLTSLSPRVFFFGICGFWYGETYGQTDIYYSTHILLIPALKP